MSWWPPFRQGWDCDAESDVQASLEQRGALPQNIDTPSEDSTSDDPIRPKQEPQALSNSQAKLMELLERLEALSPILDDAPQHPLLGRLELDRAMALLNTISKEFDQAKGISQQYCEVCMETLDADRFPPWHITQLCTHPPHSCLPCLSHSISSQLDFKTWNQITCPTCSAPLEANDIEAFADDDTVTRYHRFMLAAALASDPSFRSCLRPGCPSGQLHVSGAAEPLMYCADCGFKMCYTHTTPWHDNQTCAEYDYDHNAPGRRRQEEADSAATIAGTSKPCPGDGCTARIEKNEGCDHMTCARCRHEFCWQCLAPYRTIRQRGNAGHGEQCPYHSDNLPAHALLNPNRYIVPPVGT